MCRQRRLVWLDAGHDLEHSERFEMTVLHDILRRPRLPLRMRVLVALGCLLLTVAVVPRLVCGRHAALYFERDLATQDALARSVAASVRAQRGRQFYHTGTARFDGQSAIATYQMTILGLGQVILAHPEKRDDYLPAIRTAADRLVDPATLDYAADVYGTHGVVQMAPGAGHAYLGYINLALGMLRQIDPDTRHAALHDRLTDELARRLFNSPTGMIETYPGETWPPDVAAVAGSIGLHARATGTDRQAELDRWAERFASCALDATGYLIQRIRSGTCEPLDAPRGSGTAVASYFLGFAHPALSRRLYEGLVAQGERSLLGFGAVREYASGHQGAGDVNAGFVVFGVSVGATGFALGAAMTHGDRAFFTELFRTAHLFGVPSQAGETRTYAAGGALGNALLLAMLTARTL